MDKIDKYNLVEGSIVGKLFFVALPIIATQLFQMIYNLTDMFWLGRLSGEAVAASGLVSMYIWLSVGFMLIGRLGGEIGVAQNIGRGDRDTARAYAENAIMIAAVLGVAVAVVYGTFSETLITFFGIREANVHQDAVDYLRIVSFGLPFILVTSAISGVFTGAGNSRTVLIINGIGSVTNLILDPLLIFNAGMGIHGAAIATVIAQALTAVLSVLAIKKYKNRPFDDIKLISRPQMRIVKQIWKWATPVSLESLLFTFLTMLVTPLQAAFGAAALATGRIGSQIESLTWLIGAGYASALNAFSGQNYGAGKWSRIHKCFKISTILMSTWGLLVMLLMCFGGGMLFRIFVPNEPEVIALGVSYLWILGLVQIPACLEGVAAGIFRGQGKTIPPSVAGISSNALRVIMAYGFIHFTDLGLNGIWIAVAISAAIRGVWVYVWYLLHARKTPGFLGKGIPLTE